MLTLVIPTKNRSAFLRRALEYYAAMSCPFPILIGDSSEPEHLARTQQAVRALGARLNIRHVSDAQSVTERPAGWQQDGALHALIQQVETPYVAFFADDDFAIVKHLQTAVRFLDTHPEYSFVSGHMALFFLKTGITAGAIQAVEPYAQQTIADDHPARRLTHFLKHYTVLEYGVSRTSQKRIRWQHVMSSSVDNLTGELMNGSLAVIQGKIAQLEHLVVVRQAHSQQTSAQVHDAFDWMSDTAFPRQWSRLLDVLTRELTSCTGGGDGVEARRVVTSALWSYLSQVLTQEWSEHYGQRQTGWWSATVRRSPAVRTIWHALRPLLPGMEPSMSLPALMRRSSRYHEDFLPIYRAVTSPQRWGDEQTGPHPDGQAAVMHGRNEPMP